MNLSFSLKNDRHLLCLSFAFSLLSLGGAYFVQLLGYQPCSLCVYQRIPYAIIITLSGLGIALKNRQAATNFILSCIIIIFICEVGLAAYHVLIEHHIIEETSSCNASLNLSDDPNEAVKQLMAKPTISCANPEVIIIGLSMAEWNLFFSSLISAIIIYSRMSNATTGR